MVARGPPKTKVAGSSPVMVDLFWCFPILVLLLQALQPPFFLFTASAVGTFVVLVCGEEVSGHSRRQDRGRLKMAAVQHV